MVLMAIDHVRVYSGVPPGGPTAGVFFTRWVTHFCAPVFVFLAGTAAYLYRERSGSPSKLSGFLVSRGLWLVLLELTVLRVAWTFNFQFSEALLAGVIWMLGWCMVLMAVVSRVPLPVVTALGLAIVFGHNLMDPQVQQFSQQVQGTPAAWIWQLLYFGGVIPYGASGALGVLYVIFPWIGVMALGFAFGAVLRFDPERRRRWCLRMGLGAIVLFVVLRGLNLYGDPRPWGTETQMPALLSFLNTTKYPASLLFLLMTLGPSIAVLPLLDRWRGKVAGALTTFGRVPMFYYLVHIPLIHAAAILVARLRNGTVDPWLFANHPMLVPPAPDGYTWSLGLLYLVTTVVVVVLYGGCRWYADLKRRRPRWWMSYL